MKYPALGLALLALACAPRAVDRTAVLDAHAPGRDARMEAGPSPGLPGPLPTDARSADSLPADPDPPPPAPDAAAAPDAPEDAPPARPDFSSNVAASCAGEGVWESGKQYEAGDTVVHGQPRRKFECRTWPNTPWCWLPDYEPGKFVFYDEAWIDRGACP